MRKIYRNEIDIKRLTPFNVQVEESDILIYADKKLNFIAEKLIKEVRIIIKNFILQNPTFLKTLKPLTIKTNNHYDNVIKDMIDASIKANVGPMASVAGVVSEYVGKRLLSYSKEIIVENGGDIFLKVDETIKIGIYAGKSPLSMKIALVIEDVEKPFSVCTSSGSFGHSLSFGNADAVCIIAKNSALADAVATSVANLIKSEKDIEKGINFGKSIKGVEGVSIIIDEKTAFWGNFKISSF